MKWYQGTLLSGHVHANRAAPFYREEGGGEERERETRREGERECTRANPPPGWVRLVGRAMLGQTVVKAIIYGFVRTD